MGGMFIFDEDELAGMSNKQRRTLSDAIHRHIRTSPEIKRILRAKHQHFLKKTGSRGRTGTRSTSRTRRRSG